MLLTGLMAASTEQAGAADLPVSAPVTKAPAFIPYNWTGFYGGVNVGYGWAHGDVTGTLAGLTGTSSETLPGIIGGGQIGYNWQTSSNIVLGIESDIQGSGESKTSNRSFVNQAYSGTARGTYFGTIRGRVGYAIDRWMPYVTGGWGYGEATVDATLGAVRTISISRSKGLWVVGGGVETAIAGNWTAKAEYLLMGTEATNSLNTILGPLTTSTTIRNNIVRVGVNYRL